MLAVQKPTAFFSPSPAHMRPAHARHPSAPVVIRPTHTPGLLSISKPVLQPKQQNVQPQQHARAPKQSLRGKNQRSPQPALAKSQPVEDDKKSLQSKQSAAATSDKVAKSGTSAPSSEKSPRGRQSGKSAAKDKADRSASQQRPQGRRPHQPSPIRIPQQNESAHPPANSFRAQSFVHRDQDSNLFDPFVASSASDNESSDQAAAVSGSAKPLSFRAPPQLTSRPSGKLARRRQNGHAENFTPSKPVPAGRKGHKNPATSVSQSGSLLTFATPSRPAPRRGSTEVAAVDWDEFPVCDDMTVVSSPTTPIRETASVPPKRSNITWQQSLIDDAPRTAPLSSAANFVFPAPVAYSTPSPVNHRRHRRVPSEGVFAMSMDEDSSESSDEFKKYTSVKQVGRSARQTPPPAPDSAPSSFYAGSVFQNSPSPDELPVPAFRA